MVTMSGIMLRVISGANNPYLEKKYVLEILSKIE
jgi:hypothetical protein